MVKQREKERILIVDDSEMNRSILADMLGDEYDVLEAEDGEVALSLLKSRKTDISLVLLDIVMPNKDGFDVLTEMNRTRLIEDIPVIMVSAETASAQIERAYELGATDFIMRPFDASIVHRRVVNTIFLYAKQRKLLNVIEDQIAEKEQNNSLMVDILSHIVEFRNGESGMHILHVRTITDLLLRRLVKKTDKYNVSEEDISAITVASALHDIGKIGIDDKILNKPGKLTPEEFSVMKTHSRIGATMLEGISQHQDVPIVKYAYQICRWHHERWDGRGYPDGLKGDDIPIAAQIVALADVYDALTSERVYKPPIKPDAARDMILNGECGAFNPLLLECLLDEFDIIRDTVRRGGGTKAAHRELRNLADVAINSKNSASERTLRLLDYERMKYRFYAELTDEIQFEYNFPEKHLILSARGAEQLGVEQEMFNPQDDDRLKAQFGRDWLKSLKSTLSGLSVDSPDYKGELQLALGGEYRWYSVIMRTIWTDEATPVIESVIGKLVDVNEAHIALDELKEKSIRDPLTGLLNREGLGEELVHKFDNFPERNYAVAVFDIDLFKSANDIYGHQFGDRVLKEVAERMVHSTRVHDICARVGGDEFLIIFDHDSDIHPIIARVFKALCGKVGDFDLTVSMGVVEMTDKSDTYNSLFHKADLALYVSKKAGRATYNFYDKTMEDGATQ